jgi:hypothetical protein
VSQEKVDLYRQVGVAINSPEGVPEALLAPQFRIENIVTAVSDKTFYGAAARVRKKSALEPRRSAWPSVRSENAPLVGLRDHRPSRWARAIARSR